MPRFNRREMLALALAAAAGSRQNAFAQDPSSDLVKYVDARSFAIRHRASLDLADAEADAAELWIPVPRDDPRQIVHDVVTEPRVPIVSDSTGLARVARLFVTNRLPGRLSSLDLEVRYRVTCRRTAPDRAALAQYTVREYKKDAMYRHHTRAATLVETTDRRIREIAKECRGRDRSPVEIARAAYDWVLDHVAYRELDDFRGAVYCLEHGQGECGEYSALWVAICRAAGVPARIVSGFWGDEEDGWHCWAEFMRPNGPWLPVDASMGDQSPMRRDYFFCATDNRRVALCRTNDVELRGVKTGLGKIGSLQIGAWWWQGRRLAPEARAPEAAFHVVGRPIELA